MTGATPRPLDAVLAVEDACREARLTAAVLHTFFNAAASAAGAIKGSEDVRLTMDAALGFANLTRAIETHLRTIDVNTALLWKAVPEEAGE